MLSNFNIDVIENSSLNNIYCFDPLLHMENLIFSIFPLSNSKNILKFNLEKNTVHNNYDINNDNIVNIVDIIDLVNCIIYQN